MADKRGRHWWREVGTLVAITGLLVTLVFNTVGVWRDVEVHASRIGSIDLSDATVRSVTFVGCKLGHVNLRAARVRDLGFRDCTVDVLDLGDAELERAAFPGSTVHTLEVPRATLRHVDLRGLEPRVVTAVEGLAGATIDDVQLALLAPSFAQHLGIRVAG